MGWQRDQAEIEVELHFRWFGGMTSVIAREVMGMTKLSSAKM